MGGGLVTLPIVQPKAIPVGTQEIVEKRSDLLRTFASKVSSNLRIPEYIVKSPPRDVSTVPAICGILTARELHITDCYDAVALAEAIAKGIFTAVEVVTAFSKRAIIAHQLTSCLTDWFMDDGIKQAQELDDYLLKNGKTIGPLHGVPISIKEHMPIAGKTASEGSMASTFVTERDCDLVSILREAGAVFYCKTNQPQSIMHLECTSHFGRTVNPFNINLSAGGSSGGEAALIALKGSVLGVGSDIGGSIRAPSAFCGIYGFKPTSDIMPQRDMLSHCTGAELNIQPSVGPMCRTLRDMDLFCKTIIDAEPWLLDPKLVPIPWSGLQYKNRKPIRIGIIEHDGFITPQPPVRRAVAWARDRLSDPRYSSLVQVKPFKPYNAAKAWSLIRKMYWPDGGIQIKNSISVGGEPVLPLTDWIVADAAPEGVLSADGVTQLREARNEFRFDFAQSWEEQGVDVVIGPAFVGPASAHDTAFYWTYTSLYNMVDYPGAVFPTPIRVKAGEKYADDYTPLSKECAHVKELWDTSNFEGAPINLQIVARRRHDNQLFGVLEALKDALDLH